VDRLIDLVDYQKAKDICITQSMKAIDGVLDASNHFRSSCTTTGVYLPILEPLQLFMMEATQMSQFKRDVIQEWQCLVKDRLCKFSHN
jgi:hypothetical protein